jgi:hypothetical protein
MKDNVTPPVIDETWPSVADVNTGAGPHPDVVNTASSI